MKVKLENKGKGDLGTGMHYKVVAYIPHPDPELSALISKNVTFWTIAKFEGTVEVSYDAFVKLLNNLEYKENDKGKFLVWNGN